MAKKLARMNSEQVRMAAALTTLTRADVIRYRQIWRQVAGGDNTWVLLGDEGGEFGSIGSGSPSQSDSDVLLVQMCILGETEERAYSVNLLVPASRAIDVKVPNAGSVAGRPAALTVTTLARGVVVGLTVGGEDASAVGVSGYKSLETGTSEIGRFSLHGQTLRLIARTQRLVGSQTDENEDVQRRTYQ